MSTVTLHVPPADAVAAPVPAGRTRHGATDVLRIAAVVPVVYYHAGVLAQLPALIGMHALIAAAVIFAARPSRGTASEVVRKRLDRLLLPWLVFGVWHLLTAVRSGNYSSYMLLIGGSLHLWFVPFIFVVTAAVALYCRTRPWPTGWGRVAIWAAFALAAIHLECRTTPWLEKLPPWWQFFDGLTAVLVAAAVLSTPGRAVSKACVAAAIALVSVPLWLPWRTPTMMTISPAGIGTLLFVLVSLLPAGANRLTDFVGRASFGLYLMHMVALYGVYKVAGRLLHKPRETFMTASSAFDPATVAACAAVAIVVSLLAIAVIERTRLRRLVM